MGEGVFAYCSGLTRFDFPSSITTIGNYFFQVCTSLTSVTIPSSVTSIGWSSFRNCTSLTEITIPSSVTSISNYAFSGCTSLSSITCLATTAPTLGTDVFYALPSSGTLIYPCDSDYNTWLEQLGWEKNACNSAKYDITATFNVQSTTAPTVICGSGRTSAFTEMYVDGVQIDVTSAHTFNTTGEHTVQYMLADNTTITNSAFQGCPRMTSIELPDTLITISGSSFYGCTSLSSVTIPDNVTSIGGSAFSGCSSLNEVVIPNSVTSIASSTFSHCSSLRKITIGSGVQEIGVSSYALLELPVFTGCTKLTEIVSLATTAPKLGSKAFNGIQNNNGTLYVPNGSDYNTWTTVLTTWNLEYI